jgi:alpha-glucoside transport system permease protein
MVDRRDEQEGERAHRSLTDEERREPPEHAEAGAPERVAEGGPVTGGPAVAVEAPPRRAGWGKFGVGLAFLAPAALVLGAIVVYPILWSILRSLYDRGGDTFIGLDNYARMFADAQTYQATVNTFIWVLVAPAAVTALGLMFAVVTERVKAGTAFKTIIFMPMAISFLAVGVIFRLVYEHNPDTGVLNAASQSIVSIFQPPGDYPGARPSVGEAFTQTDAGHLVRTDTVSTGAAVAMGLIGIRPALLPDPDERVDAQEPAAPAQDEIAGVVWFDFSPGGEAGVVESGEPGLPNVLVEAVLDGAVVASDRTGPDGTFALSGLDPGEYTLRMNESTFRQAFPGIPWLGQSLVVGSTIGAFVWMWAGFAMVIIAAGLAAIPRETMESARVDGANEWQVFRRITFPLLMPVIMVVFVTLVINVMKIFDLVLIIAPGGVRSDADVLALRMWTVSFGGARDFGLGSAIAVFLFVLVIPPMIYNIRRFRMEG